MDRWGKTFGKHVPKSQERAGDVHKSQGCDGDVPKSRGCAGDAPKCRERDGHVPGTWARVYQLKMVQCLVNFTRPVPKFQQSFVEIQ